jgi:hypothetical protein
MPDNAMAPVIPLKPPTSQTEDPNESRQQKAPQDAILLLRTGGGAIAVGLLLWVLTKTVFGGIGPQGPHTNAGWLSLIVTMMCLPFGLMLFALGAAKWFRKRD